MRVLAIVQARMGSTRLPGKALLPLAGRPMLAHVLTRAKAIPGVDQVVLATTTRAEDDPLIALADSLEVPWLRGPSDDVLGRFLLALDAHPAEIVVRITGDCPLLDPAVSGLVLAEYLRLEAEGQPVAYCSNCHPRTWPDGLDTEVVSAAALRRAGRDATAPADREHVTTYIAERPCLFTAHNVSKAGRNMSGIRWTVDTEADLDRVTRHFKQRMREGELSG